MGAELQAAIEKLGASEQAIYRDRDGDLGTADALAVVLAAARAQMEADGEWEYAWATGPDHTYDWNTFEEAEEFIGNPVRIRRRAAGPWRLAPDA